MKENAVEFSKTELILPGLPKVWEGVTLCHMSDFHSARYADYGEQIAAEMKKQKPDLIFVTGDMVDFKKDKKGAYFFSVTDRLAGIPILCSMGNHEQRMSGRDDLQKFKQACAQRGILLLDQEKTEYPLRGELLSVYGYLQDFYHLNPKCPQKARLRQDVTTQDLVKKLGTCKKDPFFVLLAHDPAPFKAYAQWGAPLILSGHIHGGWIRLPFVGGLFSPARRFFPPYSSGVYQKQKSTLVVSRGLGVGRIPRVNNRPEVGFLVLKGK